MKTLPLRRYVTLAAMLAFLTLGLAYQASAANDFQEGDLIFQESNSPQCAAIKEATSSRYTHCGLIFDHNGTLMVYEAIGPVIWTPLSEWINRGVDGHYVLMRLKDRDQHLDAKAVASLKKAGKSFLGQKYDILFQWSDEAIYCSELVWKVYDRGLGLKLVKLRSFKDFNLDGPLIRQLAQKRYGSNLPLSEPVVAPSDLMASPLLITVSE